MTGPHPSILVRGGTTLAAIGRGLGVVAVLATAGMAAVGAPANAQVPTLPPLTLPPPDPSTTTTTLLLPLVPTGDLLPAPDSSTPPSNIVPLPTTAVPRRTTAYKPPPVPPSTPARALAGQAKARATVATTRGTPGGRAEGNDLGEDTGYGDLPFDAAATAQLPTGDDTMELGIEATGRDQVGNLASVAGGLIAMVLFGVALWLRGEIRREPALPPW